MTILSLLAGYIFFQPKAAAQTLDTSQQSNIQYESSNLTIKDNAIQTSLTRNNPQPVSPPIIHSSSTERGRHNTSAEKQITTEQLSLYLQQRNSPLAPYAVQLLSSPYWSTIIGICTIEQYNCTKAPFNNYWGLMKSGGGLQHFATIPDGIAAIDAFLTKASAAHPTIESLNCWYVQPCSSAWLTTVIKTKTLIENLN